MKKTDKLNEIGCNKFISLEKWGLSTFSLKIIAVVTMFMDHFAYIFCQNHQTLYTLLRSVGRLSFPIFAFLIVEGFFHTKNRIQYGIRLGVFALISEIPYNLMYGNIFDLKQQNVMFTLFIGYLLIWGMDNIFLFRVNYPKMLVKHISPSHLNVVMGLLVIIGAHGTAYLINSAYSYAGVMLIMCFYTFHKYHYGKIISNIVFNFGMYINVPMQWWGAVSVIPLALYNGKPGKRKWKYFFYWFYPLHILLLVVLRIVYLYLKHRAIL